jgi:hypothetical protein
LKFDWNTDFCGIRAEDGAMTEHQIEDYCQQSTSTTEPFWSALLVDIPLMSQASYMLQPGGGLDDNAQDLNQQPHYSGVGTSRDLGVSSITSSEQGMLSIAGICSSF